MNDEGKKKMEIKNKRAPVTTGDKEREK